MKQKNSKYKKEWLISITMTQEDKKIEWDSRLSFLMAMIGAAIGLGNIWRYPYVAYTNGGGTFLIPYLCAIFILGIPFIFLEYSIGFKFKTSLVNALRKIKPKFEILGWFVSITAFLILCYYVCIVGWDLIYIILSVFKAWGSNPGNFLTITLLHSQNNLSALSIISWPVVASLVFIWMIIWRISKTDVNSGIGRVTKILIPALIIIMFFIVIFSLTLPGASLGYSVLLQPKWNMLLDVNVWLAAFGQILFSLSMGVAVIITYTSYLPEDSDLIKDGLTVVASNCGFEVFTAFGVFSILGFMAFTQNVPVDHVVTQGSGLIFVAFPTVFNSMGFMGYIIGPLFFLCVFFAGITTTISYLEPLSLGIAKKFKISRSLTSSILCLIGFLFSLIFATGSGNYILTIFDSFINQFAILFGIICQCLIFGWYYKIDELLNLINSTSKFNLTKYWIFIIKYLIPIILFVIWITGIYTLILENNFQVLLIEAIISIILIIIPLVLTWLPAKKNIKPKINIDPKTDIKQKKK